MEAKHVVAGLTMLSLLLALTWLALSRSLAPVHLLTAAVAGLGARAPTLVDRQRVV